MKVRMLYCLLGIGIGVVASLLLSPGPVEVVRTEVVEKVKIEEVIKWQEKEVVRWKTRVETRPDGTVITEESGSSSAVNSGSSTTIISEEAHTAYSLSAKALPTYRIGASVRPDLDWKNPGNYLLTGGIRLGRLPLWVEAQVGFAYYGIGVTYEW